MNYQSFWFYFQEICLSLQRAVWYGTEVLEECPGMNFVQQTLQVLRLSPFMWFVKSKKSEVFSDMKKYG